MKSKATFFVLLLCACTFGKTFGQADPGCGGMMFSKTVYGLKESGTIEVLIGNYSSGFKSGTALSPYDATFTITIPPVLRVHGDIDFSAAPFPVTVVSQMMNALGSTIIVFTAPKGIAKGVSGTIAIPVVAYKTDLNILYATVKTDVNLSYPPSGNLNPANDLVSMPVYVNAALPVKLSSFTLTGESNLVGLSWTTTAEENSELFEIERSINGKIWHQIGIVPALGNSTEKAFYTYTDTHPASGANYYRLKMIDRDKTLAYSGIRNIRLEQIELNLFPNPVTDVLNIRMADWENVSAIQLRNMNGEMVYSKGTIAKTIDVSRLAQGAYLVKIIATDGMVVNRRIWVQR